MDCMAGGDLVNLTEACGCVSEEKVWPISHQSASAIQYSHIITRSDKNTAHGDIKAENVFFDVDRNTYSRCPDGHKSHHWPDDVIGTLSYLAPEMLED